jgi:hypothetical protein
MKCACGKYEGHRYVDFESHKPAACKSGGWNHVSVEDDLDAQLAAKDAEIAELKQHIATLREAQTANVESYVAESNQQRGRADAFEGRLEQAEARVKDLEKKLLVQTEATAQMATTADNASRDAKMWRGSFEELQIVFDCTGTWEWWSQLRSSARSYDGSSGKPWRAP